MQISNPMINTYGHFGGFINGFLMFPILSKPIQENDGGLCGYKIWLLICLTGEIVYFVVGFLVVYLV